MCVRDNVNGYMCHDDAESKETIQWKRNNINI